MEVQEAIQLINSSDDLYCIDDAVELLEGETKLLAEGIDVSRHRLFEISTSYFELDNGILGIRGVSKIYSEMMSASDCNVQTRCIL